eukprot:TRINITY_DN23668_c0_g1_i1.p1 TRINITY_DN23668_c0_g1~~TRINITY_DN23668_c0_g1_i1.p1  ORF type:complete len:102 (+),score=14.56 TRINITY_DN23668_c0_g1_i1:184-489(+)
MSARLLHDLSDAFVEVDALLGRSARLLSGNQVSAASNASADSRSKLSNVIQERMYVAGTGYRIWMFFLGVFSFCCLCCSFFFCRAVYRELQAPYEDPDEIF